MSFPRLLANSNSIFLFHVLSSLRFADDNPGDEESTIQQNKGASSEIGKLTHIIQINNAATEGISSLYISIKKASLSNHSFSERFPCRVSSTKDHTLWLWTLLSSMFTREFD